MFKRKDKLVGTLFNLVENTLKKNTFPKYKKYDSFWNLYYNESKIEGYFDCKLRVYYHTCKDIISYNTKTMIKYKNNNYDERIFYVDNIGLIKYELEKDGIMVDKNKIDPELCKFLTKLVFINILKIFLEKNKPGKTIWTEEMMNVGKLSYIHNIFYFEEEKILKGFVEVIKKIINIQNGKLIFKYNSTIRQKILYEEYEKLKLNKEFVDNIFLKIQIELFIELDSLFD